MYLMWTCSCLSNHFSMVCFLKACYVPSGRGGINMQIAGGTCLPAPGAWWLQCHTLGQALWASITGGSAIRRYSPYLPYHAIPFVSPETWMISWEVFHIVSQSLPCFLRSNLLNSCARQVAPRLLPALPSRCTPLSSRLGHWTFPKGYGATWCVHLCHGCHRYSNLDSTNTNLEEKQDVVQSKQQRCWFLSSSVGSILKFSHAAMHMINDYL